MTPRALVLLAFLGCTKSLPPLDDDPKAAAVLEAGAAMKAGTIGTAGGAESSYALVDVENASAQDRLITVEGQLLGEGERPVAALGADELRVPARERRTFALVADQVAPAGARPRFTVTHAVALSYPPQVEISERQDRPGDLFVATGKAKNLVERAASAVVACTFYDERGGLLARPFTVLELGPGAEQRVRFEGPSATRRAVIFAGQVAFKQ